MDRSSEDERIGTHLVNREAFRQGPRTSLAPRIGFFLVSAGVFLAVAVLLLACIPGNHAKDDFRGFQWDNRLILVFLQPGTEPGAARTLEAEILGYAPEIAERDIRYFIVPEKSGVRSNAEHADRFDYDAIRRHYTPGGDRFTVILVGKDGGIKYRRDDRLNPPEILDFIDGMPMRRRELSLREGPPDL